jgi:DNA-binding NarL/FixJ family response regulator
MKGEKMDTIKVLLADDHPAVRAGLRTMLEGVPDIEVVAEACNGLEAVEGVARYSPQVALVDLRMPKLDGLQATRQIHHQYPATAVVILTIDDNDARALEAVQAGARGYLLKDASREVIIYTIRAVGRGGALLRSELLPRASTSLTHVATEQRERFQGLVGPLERLTPREREVLYQVVQGHSNKAIAQALVISEDTVKKHVQSLMGKLEATSRTQLAVMAVQYGRMRYEPELVELGVTN